MFIFNTNWCIIGVLGTLTQKRLSPKICLSMIIFKQDSLLTRYLAFTYIRVGAMVVLPSFSSVTQQMTVDLDALIRTWELVIVKQMLTSYLKAFCFISKWLVKCYCISKGRWTIRASVSLYLSNFVKKKIDKPISAPQRKTQYVHCRLIACNILSFNHNKDST